jgi:hypothetical protein
MKVLETKSVLRQVVVEEEERSRLISFRLLIRGRLSHPFLLERLVRRETKCYCCMLLSPFGTKKLVRGPLDRSLELQPRLVLARFALKYNEATRKAGKRKMERGREEKKLLCFTLRRSRSSERCLSLSPTASILLRTSRPPSPCNPTHRKGDFSRTPCISSSRAVDQLGRETKKEKSTYSLPSGLQSLPLNPPSSAFPSSFFLPSS